MMQLPPILSALCWCERKSNLYLLYDKNWNLRVLRWRDLTVSVQISHLTRARFKSCTPGVPFVSNSPLPGYGPLSNTRRLPGRGGGCHRFELNGAFYKRWTQSVRISVNALLRKKICCFIILKRINRKFFMLGGCASLIIQNRTSFCAVVSIHWSYIFILHGRCK